MSQNILITGAAGAIAQAISPHLRQRGHYVRTLDRLDLPNPITSDMAHLTKADLTDEHLIGDIADPTLAAQAVSHIDTVIHLAAYRNDADFMDILLEPNVIGLYQICNAARHADVKRLVLASSIQAVSGRMRAGHVAHVEERATPTNHYGLTKLWAEDLGEMYARCYDMSAINVRIGWFARDAVIAERIDSSEHGPDVYLSHGDAQRFFARCVESEKPAAGASMTVFATSQPRNRVRLNSDEAWDSLGYVPVDVWHGVPFS
ncbi:MAG: NAD(P)-dependent oxidoreductase [Chloroflexota bacterium]